MSVENTTTQIETRDTVRSVAKSLVNQYWPFTLFPLAACTLGMAIASVEYGWSWTGYGLSLAMWWLLDQGMKSVDLSAETVNVDVDSRIQFTIGSGMILLGFGVGVALAWLSTWWYLVLLAVVVFLGFAYVLEFFGGRLHDRQYHTGWGNLGFCLGWVPTVSGYVFVAESVSPGIAIFAIGPLFCCGTLAWVTEDMKDEVYRQCDIRHRRETPTDVARLKRRELTAQWFRILGFVLMAVGIVVEFGVVRLPV